jgi:transposase InsO family protein
MRSVGSRGDSYDNALAENVNRLYKAELIHRQGVRRSAKPSVKPLLRHVRFRCVLRASEWDCNTLLQLPR